MKRIFFLLILAPTLSFASGTYVPPPPPKLPAMLSERMVSMGRDLFENNLFKDQTVEIYNYLGLKPCSACHDKEVKLKPDSVASKFKDIRKVINSEILSRTQGTELPPQDPAMEALVQYLVHKYKLYDYKLSK